MLTKDIFPHDTSSSPTLLTFHKHPEESGQMEISGEDERDTPGELQAGVTQGLDRLDGLHHRRGDPAGVR